MAFTNLILGQGDTFLYFYPYWEAAAAALRAGRVPLWNPQLFMGAPFLANSQVGFFYPLNWPLWLLLPVPYAVSATILLHLFIAGAGTYRLGRRALALSRPGSLLAAGLFALGGYLTAQVAHVNQLQGLAWLPWILALADRGAAIGHWRLLLRRGAWLGLIFALQLVAGHTQTVFITGVAVLIWLVGKWFAQAGFLSGSRSAGGSLAPRGQAGSKVVRALLVPALGVLLALLLAAVQLLPAAELAQRSARAAGLAPNEVLSFSLNPLLLGAALLPAYGQALFSEYVAYLPLSGLLLALVGAWQWRVQRQRLPALPAALLLAGAGLFLALGRFDGLYLLLARLPGFNLFRAPARWLVLYGLGAALLAGVGLDEIRDWRLEIGAWRQRVWRPLLAGGAAILLLAVSRFVAVPLAGLVPVGAEAPVEAPAGATVAGWLLEGVILLLLLWWGSRIEEGRRRRPLSAGIMVLAAVALFLASGEQPYNRLTAPQAYFSLRPPVARLQALGECELLPARCQVPPGRLLSLSQIFFDPGDLAEIRVIYGDQLTADGLYDYVIAVKQKEVLSPNLPLAYGLSSVDGFDGGILPLRDYTRLTSLILPPGAESVDGRLREYLQAVPEARWLDLFNARYLITDKVGDVWREVGEQSAFFDLQHPLRLQPGEAAPVGYLPAYEATALWLLAQGTPGQVALEAAGGRTVGTFTPEQIGENLWQVRFPQPLAPAGLRLQAGEAPWLVQGLALVDERDHTFQALVPGNYRLIYSGDVKIYENLDVLPRAFVVDGWTWQPDVDAAVAAMAAPAFDPAHAAVLVGAGEAPGVDPVSATVTVSHYEPEQVVVQAELAAAGLLLLTDAAYPGWEATVDGVPATLYRADGLFRGVMVPAGAHEVTFTFHSRSYQIGAVVSLAALLLLAGLLAWSFYRGGAPEQ